MRPIVLLYDPDPVALERAPEGVERVGDLEGLAPCGLVIEAAPEDFELRAVAAKAGWAVADDGSAGSDDEPAAERFSATLGMRAEWVGDAPGLVLGRIVAQLVNGACFALGEGTGSAGQRGNGPGLNHPRGPLEWGALIGFDRVLTTIDGLHRECREERYRPAPALLRRARGLDDD